MLVRPALLRLVAAALVAPAVAFAAEEPARSTSNTPPAPPLGVLAAPDKLPTQQILPAQPVQSRPLPRRLSPSELYARDHARRAPSTVIPSFATVRPQMRKPLPGEGPDNAKEPEEAAAAPKPVKAAKAPAPAIDGFFADKPVQAPAAKPRTKVTKKATTTTVVTAGPTPPGIPELIVRPATPAMLYERAAVQYRDLRRRDLEMVRHLLPERQYESKLAAIEASYRPQQ